MDNEWLYILLIYILGLGLCVLELFVPSGGIIGIAATVCVVRGTMTESRRRYSISDDQ